MYGLHLQDARFGSRAAEEDNFYSPLGRKPRLRYLKPRRVVIEGRDGEAACCYCLSWIDRGGVIRVLKSNDCLTYEKREILSWVGRALWISGRPQFVELPAPHPLSWPQSWGS